MATRGIVGVHLNGQDIMGYNHYSSGLNELGCDIKHELSSANIYFMREYFDNVTLVDLNATPNKEECQTLDNPNTMVALGYNDRDQFQQDMQSKTWYELLRQTQGQLMPDGERSPGPHFIGDASVIDPAGIEYKYMVNLDTGSLEIDCYGEQVHTEIDLRQLKYMTDEQFLQAAQGYDVEIEPTIQTLLDSQLSGAKYNISIDDEYSLDPADFGWKYGNDPETGRWLGPMPDIYTVTITNTATHETLELPIFEAEGHREINSKKEQYDIAMERAVSVIVSAIDAASFDTIGEMQREYGYKDADELVRVWELMEKTKAAAEKVFGADFEVLRSAGYSYISGYDEISGKMVDALVNNIDQDQLVENIVRYMVDKVELLGEICQPTNQQAQAEWLSTPTKINSPEEELSLAR